MSSDEYRILMSNPEARSQFEGMLEYWQVTQPKKVGLKTHILVVSLLCLLLVGAAIFSYESNRKLGNAMAIINHIPDAIAGIDVLEPGDYVLKQSSPVSFDQAGVAIIHAWLVTGGKDDYLLYEHAHRLTSLETNTKIAVVSADVRLIHARIMSGEHKGRDVWYLGTSDQLRYIE